MLIIALYLAFRTSTDIQMCSICRNMNSVQIIPFQMSIINFPLREERKKKRLKKFNTTFYHFKKLIWYVRQLLHLKAPLFDKIIRFVCKSKQSKIQSWNEVLPFIKIDSPSASSSKAFIHITPYHPPPPISLSTKTTKHQNKCSVQWAITAATSYKISNQKTNL